MKILVTGSSGFIGFHLVKRLLKNGHNVIGVDNHNDYYDVKLKKLRKATLESQNFNFYLQDINHLNIKDDDIDIAINLAAQPGIRIMKDREHLYQHSNINGFKAFCNFCKQKKINKIIYASSSSVYSDNHTKKFTEGFTKLEPKSLYGQSKLKNELYASKFCKKLDISVVGLRFFSVYGPYGRPDMAYFLFTNSIRKNKKMFLNNKGLMSRDMTFIDDVICGIEGAINYINRNDIIKNEIFNIGNDYPITTIDLLKSIELRLNAKAKIKDFESENESLRTHADITKAKNLLGYEPKFSFNEGIEIFLDWYKAYERLKN
tara:strand:+ start:48 stop:1001 length:954 start_codon:yes stop_codon:yes gene_type:complete